MFIKNNFEVQLRQVHNHHAYHSFIHPNYKAHLIQPQITLLIQFQSQFFLV